MSSLSAWHYCPINLNVILNHIPCCRTRPQFQPSLPFPRRRSRVSPVILLAWSKPPRACRRSSKTPLQDCEQFFCCCFAQIPAGFCGSFGDGSGTESCPNICVESPAAGVSCCFSSQLRSLVSAFRRRMGFL